MPQRRARRMRLVCACCAAAWTAATVVVAAAPARADTESYLQKLREAGISTPGGDAEMKEWGWEVCQLFAQGVSPENVVRQAVYNSGSHPQYGMTVDQANMIVNSAVSDLCNAHK
ncbi:DUF732 domain-containing protein [Mycobacterium intracellulare]|uniref:DUF732 domain-containing protein n=1 Tax=Mycobacterium intracellulare TaxID=1767 RepID=UPI000A62FBE8|nr:DUF732 domain-containing protein [Mycobacterium intracellulare]